MTDPATVQRRQQRHGYDRHLGFTTNCNYNLLNQEVLTVDPLGRNEATAWSPTGELLATIDRSGGEWRTLYDAAGRVTAALDPLQNAARFRYDDADNVTLATDPRGYSTTYGYDADDRCTLATDPNGNTTRWAYDKVSQITQVTDGNGHATSYGYDPVGRPDSVTDADGHTWATVYYPTGSVLAEYDPNGNPPAVYLRDGEERVVAAKDPLGNVTGAAYDKAGLLTAAFRPSGAATYFFYNADEEPDIVVDPRVHPWVTSYDAVGDVVARYDPLGHGTFYGYDGDREETSEGLATGALTRFWYTGVSDVGQEQDPDKNVTITYYDRDERVAGGRDPLGNATYRAYNADSQVTQQVDADGRQINSTYDPGGRLTSQVWILANLSQADVFNYTYDHADNLTGASNNYGSYGYTLDPADRVTRQVDPFTLTLNFTADANGNVTLVTDSAGGSETSVYNADNLLSSRRLTGGPGNAQLRLDLAYTPDNLIDHLTRYSDTAGNTTVGKTQNTWDANGNVTEVKHTNGSTTTLEDFQYSYDAANRLTSETDTISGTATTTNYGYDGADQLTSAGAASYNWDSNGNSTNSGSQVGPANQLLNDGAWKYNYDPAGNVVSKVGVAGGPNAGVSWAYTYDNVNHLVTATKTVNGTQTLQETDFYDVYGNRVELDVTQSGTTTVTKFAYNEVSGNGNIWADLSSGNQVQTRREYLDGLDAVFARIASTGTVDWYLPDHLGSIRGLMSNSAALDDTLTYNAWGSVTSESTPANGDRYKFAGYQFDASTGLYYVMARWFDPISVRFISADPLGLGPDSNPYRYTGNGPTNSTDPTGLITESQFQYAVLLSDLDRASVDERVKQIITNAWLATGRGMDGEEAFEQAMAEYKLAIWLANQAQARDAYSRQFQPKPATTPDEPPLPPFWIRFVGALPGAFCDTMQSAACGVGDSLVGTFETFYYLGDTAEGLGALAEGLFTDLPGTLEAIGTRVVEDFKNDPTRAGFKFLTDVVTAQKIAETAKVAKTKILNKGGKLAPESKMLSSQLEGRAKELADPKLIASLEKRAYRFFDDAETQRLLDYFKANASTGHFSLMPTAFGAIAGHNSFKA